MNEVDSSFVHTGSTDCLSCDRAIEKPVAANKRNRRSRYGRRDGSQFTMKIALFIILAAMCSRCSHGRHNLPIANAANNEPRRASRDRVALKKRKGNSMMRNRGVATARTADWWGSGSPPSPIPIKDDDDGYWWGGGTPRYSKSGKSSKGGKAYREQIMPPPRPIIIYIPAPPATAAPTPIPTASPTIKPTISPRPTTASPTGQPTTASPTGSPSASPTASPTVSLSALPSETTSEMPSGLPTYIPSSHPSIKQSEVPSVAASTEAPSTIPSQGETLLPTSKPESMLLTIAPSAVGLKSDPPTVEETMVEGGSGSAMPTVTGSVMPTRNFDNSTTSSPDSSSSSIMPAVVVTFAPTPQVNETNTSTVVPTVAKPTLVPTEASSLLSFSPNSIIVKPDGGGTSVDKRQGLQMLLYGIDILTSTRIKEYEEQTAKYIEDFYNVDTDDGILGLVESGVSNVTAVVTITDWSQPDEPELTAQEKTKVIKLDVTEPCTGEFPLTVTFSLNLEYSVQGSNLRQSDLIIVFPFRSVDFRSTYIQDYLQSREEFAELYCSSRISFSDGRHSLMPSSFMTPGPFSESDGTLSPTPVPTLASSNKPTTDTIVDKREGLHMQLYGIDVFNPTRTKTFEIVSANYIEDFYNKNTDRGVIGVVATVKVTDWEQPVNLLVGDKRLFKKSKIGQTAVDAEEKGKVILLDVTEPCTGESPMTVIFSLSLEYRLDDPSLAETDLIIAFPFRTVDSRTTYIQDYLQPEGEFDELYCSSRIIFENASPGTPGKPGKPTRKPTLKPTRKPTPKPTPKPIPKPTTAEPEVSQVPTPEQLATVIPTAEGTSLVPSALNASVAPSVLNVTLLPTVLNASSIPTALNLSSAPTVLNASSAPTVLNGSFVPSVLNVNGSIAPTVINATAVPTISNASINGSSIPTVLNKTFVPSVLNANGSLVPTVLNGSLVPTITGNGTTSPIATNATSAPSPANVTGSISPTLPMPTMPPTDTLPPWEMRMFGMTDLDDDGGRRAYESRTKEYIEAFYNGDSTEGIRGSVSEISASIEVVGEIPPAPVRASNNTRSGIAVHHGKRKHETKRSSNQLSFHENKNDKPFSFWGDRRFLQEDLCSGSYLSLRLKITITYSSLDTTLTSDVILKEPFSTAEYRDDYLNNYILVGNAGRQYFSDCTCTSELSETSKPPGPSPGENSSSVPTIANDLTGFSLPTPSPNATAPPFAGNATASSVPTLISANPDNTTSPPVSSGTVTSSAPTLIANTTSTPPANRETDDIFGDTQRETDDIFGDPLKSTRSSPAYDRKCRAEGVDMDQNTELEINFLYGVETKTHTSDFVDDMESLILDYVTTSVLRCGEIYVKKRYLAESEQDLENFGVVRVRYPENGVITSITKTCDARSPAAQRCLVLNSKILVTTMHGSVPEVRRGILMVLEDAFRKGIFSEFVSDVVGVSYLGPDPNSFYAVAAAQQADYYSTEGKVTIALMFSVTVLLGAALWVCINSPMTRKDIMGRVYSLTTRRKRYDSLAVGSDHLAQDQGDDDSQCSENTQNLLR